MEYTEHELSYLKQLEIKRRKIQEDKIRFEIKIQEDLIEYLSPNEFCKYPTSKQDLENHIKFKENLERELILLIRPKQDLSDHPRKSIPRL